MSSDDNKLEQSYSEQLSDFESQLHHTMDDESLLQDVFRGIRGLLHDHKQSETDIRKILHDRFESGQLREETFNVVQRMLDRIVAEFVDTLPGVADAKDFVDTDVIPSETLDASPPEERLQIGSVLRDRFLLQQVVAGGSMGVVYKALDRRLAEVDGSEPWVAIKVLTPKLSRNVDALRALQQEAAKGRCLAHPNIVRFVDLDREDDVYFIVMEWVEGRSLAAILDDASSEDVDLDTALEIVRQIGRALDYAHRCGVVHADIKPGNVMIMPDGNIKLIDFGVARIRQQQALHSGKFDPAVLGAATPAYSSMQVLTGEDPVPADDVFSLACLAYRLIAGYRVFGPRNAAEAAEEGMSPQRPQGLSDRQWKALKKALSFARVARYGSPKSFIDDLFGRKRSSPPVITAVDESDDTVLDYVEQEEPRRWTLVAGLFALIAAGLAYFGTQTDLLDDYIAMLPLPALSSAPPRATESPTVSPTVSPTEWPAESSIDRPAEPVAREDHPPDEPGTDAVPMTAMTADDPAPAEALPVPLQPATHTLMLTDSGADGLSIVLREDGPSAIIEFTRDSGVASGLSLNLVETGFTGNRSPGEAGQYEIEEGGAVEFFAGATSARSTISMASDPLREADRRVDLELRVAGVEDAVLATVSLTLEDDDQRAFEQSLPPNTIAFVQSQVSVGEAETAVQVDVVRFNPDAQAIDVEYDVRDVTASDGEDFFSPQFRVISFGPGQRTARILIPLVQDSAVERDEAFFLEIDGGGAAADADISRRIAVMIRDDDS